MLHLCKFKALYRSEVRACASVGINGVKNRIMKPPGPAAVDTAIVKPRPL